MSKPGHFCKRRNRNNKVTCFVTYRECCKTIIIEFSVPKQLSLMYIFIYLHIFLLLSVHLNSFVAVVQIFSSATNCCCLILVMLLQLTETLNLYEFRGFWFLFVCLYVYFVLWFFPSADRSRNIYNMSTL